MSNRWKINTFIYVFISAVGLDQLTKYIVRRSFYFGESKNILGNFLKFTFVLNENAAFGISIGPKWVYLSIVSIAIILIGYYYFKNLSRANGIETVAGALIIAGAVSNMIDRLTIKYVVDFINFGIGPHRYPYFNLADSSVVVGTILLFWSFSFVRRHEK